MKENEYLLPPGDEVCAGFICFAITALRLNNFPFWERSAAKAIPGSLIAYGPLTKDVFM